jgi:fructose/tagatose bisphosphate aldolase
MSQSYELIKKLVKKLKIPVVLNLRHEQRANINEPWTQEKRKNRRLFYNFKVI